MLQPEAPARSEPQTGEQGTPDKLAPAPQSIADLWSKLLTAAERSAATGAALEACGPGELSGRRFELKLFNPEREAFVRGRMTDIERLVQGLAGEAFRVELTLAGAADTPPPPVHPDEAHEQLPAEVPIGSQAGPTQADIEAAMELPLVRKTVELFEGRIVAVDPIDDAPEPPESASETRSD